MAWNLSQSYTTTSLPTITTAISKSDLAAGDIILKSGTHGTIFDKWVDTSRTKYWGYEQSSSKGAVYREINYPYFNINSTDTSYVPRKYKDIK